MKRTLTFWHWREQGIALVLTVIAFTMLGPFETSALPLTQRFTYWLICISVGWFSVLLMKTVFLRHPKVDDWPLAFRLVVAISLASIPISLTVRQVEWSFRGHELGLSSIINIFFVCALIGGIIYMRISTRIGVSQAADKPEAAPFLKRLPFDLGQKIISISTQDHYVEVTTHKGSTLVLIRFQDALEELGSYGGAQIHRSHWVAQDAVRKVTRQDGKSVVELTDGRTLPVSRTYSRSVRAMFA